MRTGRGSAWRGCRSRWTGRSAPSRAASGRRSAWGWPWPRSPALLLLDEPVAALDPLARREFLSTLSEAVADGGLSVMLSSHLLHDLERVCDHVILLSASRVQLCADIDAVLATHRMLVGPRRPLSEVEPGLTVITATQTQRQTRLLVRTDGPRARPGMGGGRGRPRGRDPRLHGQRAGTVGRGAPASGGGTVNLLVWRLHRNQAYFAVAALAVLAVVLLVTGTVMGDDYRSALASLWGDAELRGPGQPALPRRRGDHRPGRPHAGRAAAVRPLLGCPVAVEGVRGRHAQPGLDARGQLAGTGSA